MAKMTPNTNDMIQRGWALFEARPERLNPAQKGHQEYNCGWNDAISEYWRGIRDLPAINVDLSAYSDKVWREAYEKGKADGMPTWTPCSEQLPEAHESVLVTIRGHDVIVPMEGETIEEAIERISKVRYVSVGFLGEDGWYGADGFPSVVSPVAWMPLPPVYKGGEEE